MDKVIREGAVRAGVHLATHVIECHAVNSTGRVLTGCPTSIRVGGNAGWVASDSTVHAKV